MGRMRRVAWIVTLLVLIVGVYAGRASSSAPRLRWFSPGYMEVQHPGGIYINVHNPTSRAMHAFGHLDHPVGWPLSPDEPIDIAAHTTVVILWLCSGGTGCNGTPLVKAPVKAIIDATYDQLTPAAYVHVRPGEWTSYPA